MDPYINYVSLLYSFAKEIILQKKLLSKIYFKVKKIS